LDKVSVIIPCYNQASFLSEAIQSIFSQTHDNWEIFIVDDGSPDDTKVIAEKWCSKDPRIHYLYQENGGLSSARNFGIKNTETDFILTLDADDNYEKTFIEKALHIVKNQKEVGVVSSWIVRFNSKEKEIVTIKAKAESIDDFLFQNACNGTSFFRKKCWLQVGGYDEEMKNGYEDWDFYIRVCSIGWKVHIIPEKLFFYRQHTSSMRIDAYKNHDLKIKTYLFKKHKNLYLDNYDALISHFLNLNNREKRNVIKAKNSIDYKVGKSFLKPLRIIKSLFRWKKNQ
jgi:hypothetical protein